MSTFNICRLNETWTKSVNEFDNFLSGYTCFNSVRDGVNKGRFSGGVTVFVRSNLIESKRVHRVFNNLKDCVILRLSNNRLSLSNNILLCFLYISPEGSPIYTNNGDTNGIERFEDALLDIVSEFPDDDIQINTNYSQKNSEL